ncbi:MAG: hypothetical protein ACLP36_11330 [Acidimicrobiales bacterium]
MSGPGDPVCPPRPLVLITDCDHPDTELERRPAERIVEALANRGVIDRVPRA